MDMNVPKINYNQPNNNKPVFNGYIDKSAKKVINKVFNDLVEQEVGLATRAGEKVDIVKIKDIKASKTELFKGLESVLQPLHKKTALKFDKFWGRFYMENNKLSKDRLYFGEHGVNYKDALIVGSEINIFPPKLSWSPGTNRDDLIDFSKKLQEVGIKPIDTELFYRYTDKLIAQAKETSFLSSLITKFNGRKADKLAKEFGEPAIWKSKLEGIHKESKFAESERRKKDRAKRMLSIENEILAKEIFDK